MRQPLSRESFRAKRLETPLGPMLALAGEQALYLLQFLESRLLKEEVARFEKRAGGALLQGSSRPLESIAKELEAYFKGEKAVFETPFVLEGTPFQKRVWRAVWQIPPAETLSYAEIAAAAGRPKAVRAAAGQVAKNRLALVIPCHRVVYASGEPGRYAGGAERKRGLLELEKSCRVHRGRP